MLPSYQLSVELCAVVRRYAPRFGLVDKPGGRKAHKAPTRKRLEEEGGKMAFGLQKTLEAIPDELPKREKIEVRALRDRYPFMVVIVRPSLSFVKYIITL